MSIEDIKGLSEEDIYKILQENLSVRREIEKVKEENMKVKKENKKLKSKIISLTQVENDILKHLIYLERTINDSSFNTSHMGYYSFVNNVSMYLMALTCKKEAFDVLILMISLMDDKNMVHISDNVLTSKVEIENVTNVKSDKANRYDKRAINFMNITKFKSAIKFLIENKFIREVKGGDHKVYQVNGWLVFNGKFKELYQGDALMKNGNEYYYEKIGDVLIDGAYVIPVRFGTRRIKKEEYEKKMGEYDFMFKKK